MATIDPKQNIGPRGFMGMDPTKMQEIIQANPELADALGKSFEADLMSDQYDQMANAPIQGSRDGVGPYGMTVATPWSALAGGAERVAGRMQQKRGAGAQRAGNEALIRALGGGPGSGSPMMPTPDRPGSDVINMGSGQQDTVPTPPQTQPPMGHPGMMGEQPIQPPQQPPMPPPQAQAQPMQPEPPMEDPQAMPPAGGGPLGGPNPMVQPMPNPGGTAAGMPEPGMGQMPPPPAPPPDNSQAMISALGGRGGPGAMQAGRGGMGSAQPGPEAFAGDPAMLEQMMQFFGRNAQTRRF